jgi:OOP family OmpA-OmpF porin
MASNIVSTISEFLTPDILGKIAGASGLDRLMAQKVTGAAIPTLLGTFEKLASKPGGARRLMSAVADLPADALENLSSSLVGPAQSASNGNVFLSSLLGGSTPNLLAAGIGRFFGINTNAVQTVMGLLTPLVLGYLGRMQRAQGLDTAGLARLLTDQKDNITSAMPEGLSSLLGESTRTATGAGPQTIPRASTRMDPPGTPTSSSGADATKRTTWPYWVFALLALSGLLWSFLPRGENEIKQASVAPTPPREISTPAQGRAQGTDTTTLYITRPAANWVSIGKSPNEYVDREIFNARGESLGTVRDLLVAQDGKAAAAVIRVGRYLGIGEKDIAVPFTALRVEQRNGNPQLIIDLVRDSLQSAPAYESLPAARQ